MPRTGETGLEESAAATAPVGGPGDRRGGRHAAASSPRAEPPVPALPPTSATDAIQRESARGSGRVAHGATALMLVALGTGSALLAAALWARVGWTHPPAAILALGVWLAVAGRSLGAAGADPETSDGGLAYAGLLAGTGIAAAFGQWQRAATAPASAIACVVVWAAWLQSGRLWADLVGRHAGRGETEASAHLSREELEARGGTRQEAEDSPGEWARGAIGGWWLVSGLLAILVPATAHGHAHPFLAAAGMALEACAGGMLVAQGLHAGLLRSANRNGAQVTPAFGRQASGALATTVVAVLIALALPTFPHFSVAAWDSAITHAVPRGAVPSGGPPPQHSLAPAPAGAGGAAGAGAIGLRIVAVLALALLAATLVLVAVRLLRAWFGVTRLRRAGSFWAVLSDVFQALWAALTALFAEAAWREVWGGTGMPRQRDARAAMGGASDTGRARGAGGWGAWRFDPRARIRAAYRDMLFGAAARGHRRRAATSPRHFARQIAPALPPSTENHQRLTVLYEEARYSDHVLSPEAAGEAAGAAHAVLKHLRDPGGGAGP